MGRSREPRGDRLSVLTDILVQIERRSIRDRCRFAPAVYRRRGDGIGRSGSEAGEAGPSRAESGEEGMDLLVDLGGVLDRPPDLLAEEGAIAAAEAGGGGPGRFFGKA